MQRLRRLRGYGLSLVACLFWRCFDRSKISACSAFSLPQRETISEEIETENGQLFMGWPPSPDTLRRDLVVILAFAVIAYIVSYQKQRFRAAPQLDKISPTLPSPTLGALCVAALYGTNIAYNVLNKRLLTAHNCPVLITTVNFGTCSVCCIAAWLLKLQQRPSRVTMSLLARMIPLALLHWLGLLFANISLAEVDVAFAHTLKASEPLFTAAIILVMEQEMPSLQVLLSLIVVAAGVGVASLTEVSFTWSGFWCAMASNLGVSIRSVLSKQLISSGEEDPANLIAMLHVMAFVLSLPALIPSGECVQGFWANLEANSAKSMVPVIGLQMWLFQMASILVLSKTTPLAHSMIRTLRRPCLIIASVIAFETHIKSANAVGVVLALLGAWLYQGGVNGSEMLKCGMTRGGSTPHLHDAAEHNNHHVQDTRRNGVDMHHVHVSTIT